VKTRLQAGPKNGTVISTAVTLCRNEGIGGFYRGVQIMLISQGVYIGASLGGMQLGRAIYDEFLGASTGKTHPNDPEPWARFLLGGTVSGICCGTVTTPFERLRVLMQTQKRNVGGPLTTLREVFRSQGLHGVFTGLPITVLREIPGCIVWIGSYEWCYSQLTSTLGWGRQSAVLGSAVVAPICWSLSVFPMERIKVQMQAVGAIQESATQTMLRILRRQGMAGLMVGLVPLISRNIIIDIVQLPSADLMRSVLAEK